MKPRIQTVIPFVLLLAAAPAAHAADAPKHSQQDKLAHCSHDAKGLKGEERQKFMSECLKGPASEKRTGSHEVRHEAHHEGSPGRMKACNDEARSRNLHGDERRAFMSTCLRG